MAAITRRRFLYSLGGITAGLSLSVLHRTAVSVDGSRLAHPFVRTGRALGSTVSLTVVHAEHAVANRALSAGFDALEHVENVMSLYRPDSQLSRLNRDGILRDPHPDLITVLTAAEELSRLTEGAFDVTVQPLWSLFAEASRAGRAPTASEIAEARARVDWRAIEVTSQTVRLHGRGTQITLNGLAQGYAVDRVSAALRDHGVQHALIDTGEIAGLGHKPSADPWRVGIQDPRVENAYAALANLDDRCLATSGDYSTAFNRDRTEHHIFDPRTGRSPAELASVSVIAPNGLWADGLSTAVCVLGVEAGMRLLDRIPRSDALFITKSGETISTPNFPVVS